MKRQPEKESELSKRLKDRPPAYVASLAADAAVAAFLAGTNPEPKDLWRAIRSDEDATYVQPFFLAILDSPTYKQLLSIRLRRVSLTTIDDAVFLRDIARDVSKLMGDALLEDVILHPEKISTNEKARVFKQAAELFGSLKAPEAPPGVPEAPALTPAQASAEEIKEYKARLEKVPPELRARMRRQWKLDRVLDLEAQEEALVSDG